MSDKLLTKNFNFIGFGVLNVTMVGSGAGSILVCNPLSLSLNFS